MRMTCLRRLELAGRFKTGRELKMGFVADQDVETMICDYIEEQGIKI